MVGSIAVGVKVGDRLEKGDELGYFAFGEFFFSPEGGLAGLFVGLERIIHHLGLIVFFVCF